MNDLQITPSSLALLLYFSSLIFFMIWYISIPLLCLESLALLMSNVGSVGFSKAGLSRSRLRTSFPPIAIIDISMMVLLTHLAKMMPRLVDFLTLFAAPCYILMYIEF